MSFEVGARVRVKDDWPEAEGPVHIRTPHYARGRTGRIVRALGAFPNPEDLAFGRPAALRPLYHVAFALKDLWPQENAAQDTLLIEIYEHWLERP
jgi:nitrile hydratase